jgi:putative membrane protein
MKTLILTTWALTALPLTAQQIPGRDAPGEPPRTDPTSYPLPNQPPGVEARETGSGQTRDEHFIREAGKAGKLELKIAELAITKATRDDLKAFAAAVVKDHSTANQELAGIARSLGVDIPDPAYGKPGQNREFPKPALDPSGRPPGAAGLPAPGAESTAAGHEALQQRTGAHFDTAFIEVMQESQSRNIALFEKSKDLVSFPGLKGFIEKTLPVLKTHAVALEALQRKDPNRPDAQTGSPAAIPEPTLPGGPPSNR